MAKYVGGGGVDVTEVGNDHPTEQIALQARGMALRFSVARSWDGNLSEQYHSVLVIGNARAIFIRQVYRIYIL